MILDPHFLSALSPEALDSTGRHPSSFTINFYAKARKVEEYALIISVMPGLLIPRQYSPERISQVPLPAAWLREGLKTSNMLPTLYLTCKGTGRTLGCSGL